MRIGVTRYLVLLLSDLFSASSNDEFIRAAKAHALPKSLTTAAWVSGAIAGNGSIPRAHSRRKLFTCLTAALSNSLEEGTPRSRLLRMSDAAKLHFENIYVAIEDLRSDYRAQTRQPGDRTANHHFAALSEWREQLSAWGEGLEQMPNKGYRSVILFKRIFLALAHSEICSDMADMRVELSMADGKEPSVDAVRRCLLTNALEALETASKLLHEIQAELPTKNLSIRIDTNIMVAIAANHPYEDRFGNDVLMASWEGFDFVDRLRGGVMLSSLLLRTLIELSMYARLPNPEAPIPDILNREWAFFDKVLEERFTQFANGNRNVRPESWKDVAYPAIAADEDLSPYVRWLLNGRGQHDT